MDILHLRTEEELYFYFKKFLKTKPAAKQLDGSTQIKSNPKIILVFSFSVSGETYKISGDFSCKAAQEFIAQTEEHGSSAVVLQEVTDLKSGKTLRLADASTPAGRAFQCLQYTHKAKDSLSRKIA